MLKKIPTYKVEMDGSIVTAISLVDEPAIEQYFVCFNKEEKKRHIILSNQEKRIICGAVLVPDFPIYRYNEYDGEYYITFPKETIQHLAYNYISNGHISTFTSQHEKAVYGVNIIESWIKTSENDKSVDLGLDLPIGSWIVMAKVNDDNIWNDIKEGKMNGFSIESFLDFSEVKFNKQNNKEEKMQTIEVNDNFWSKLFDTIKAAFETPQVEEPQAEAQAEEVLDDLKEEVTEETPKAEEEVKMEKEEVIVEEEPKEAEEIAEEVVETVVMEEPTVEEAENKLQEVVDELNKKIDELTEEIETLKKENEKLSKEPSVKKVSTRQSKQDNKSNFDRMLAVMNGTAFNKN